jgi:hypothetical protein
MKFIQIIPTPLLNKEIKVFSNPFYLGELNVSFIFKKCYYTDTALSRVEKYFQQIQYLLTGW